MSRPSTVFATLVLLLAAAGCGGSGVGRLVPATGTADAVENAGGITKVTVKITVESKSPALAAHDRRAHYFSASSAGLLVRAYLHGKTTVLAQATVDIAPGSKACDGKKTPRRTCSATLMLAPSKGDDLTIFDYDAKPAGNKIPKSAHLLGYGKLTNRKIAGNAAKDVFSVFLGGVIDGLAGNAGFVSLPGDGGNHSLAIVIDPSDFGNHRISGGTKDPFANPIAVSLVETGGSGHALLSLNGGAGATSVTVKHSTDAVALEYDGGGSIGYGVTVTLRAKPFERFGGASETVSVNPLLLGSTSSFYAPGLLSLKGSGGVLTLDVGERNAPSGTAYTLRATKCYAIAQNTNLVQTSASSANFVVLAGTVASAASPGSGCVLGVSDGATTLDVAVTNVYSGVLGTPAITDTPVPTGSSEPGGIAVGPDGEIWFSECSTNKVGKITATGTSPAAVDYALPTTYGTTRPYGIAVGPDAKMWWTSGNNAAAYGSVTTAGTATAYPYGSATPEPYFIAAGPDGNMWATEYEGDAVDVIGMSGTILHHYPLTAGAEPYPIALGPDGNLWFSECGVNKIAKITPAGTVSEFPIPTSSAEVEDIVAGPDGAIWFVEYAGNKIGRIPTDATPGSGAQITEYPIKTAGADSEGITVGPDGAIWFTETSESVNKIGRLDPSAAVPGTSTGETEYASPGVEPLFITAGPDGALWFTENSSNKIGRVAIHSSVALKSRR